MLVAAAPVAGATAPVLASGSTWLGGNGVNVCAPSSDPVCGGQMHVGGWSANWWQCVELAQRLYQARGWHTANGGVFVGVNLAYQIYDQANAIGMTRQANGGIGALVPGDMIVHGSDEPFSQGAGHVSIVDSVAGSTVNVVEQNTYNNDPTGQYALVAGTLSRSGSGTIRGVVHDPDNVGTTTTPTGPDVPRLIVQRNGANLFAKVDFADAWVHIASNAADFQVAETRIVVMDAAGTLYGKEGVSGQWYTLAANVTEYAVSSNLVVIRQGTKLSAKADLYGPWVQIANDAVDVQVSRTRIGHRDAAHNLYLNDGLAGPWYGVASNVDEYALSAGLIVQRQGADVYAKAGFADAWTQVASIATDIAVSGDRIAHRDAAHRLYAKDGVGGTWYTMADDVDEYRITPQLVVIRKGTTVFAKTGLTTAWVQIATDAIDIQAAGTRIGHRDGQNELYVNDGTTGPYYDEASSVDQYRMSYGIAP